VRVAALHPPEPVRAWEAGRSAVTHEDVIAWLTDGEHDRLYWAVARARHHFGPNAEDEADARAIVEQLRYMDLPF